MSAEGKQMKMIMNYVLSFAFLDTGYNYRLLPGDCVVFMLVTLPSPKVSLVFVLVFFKTNVQLG